MSAEQPYPPATHNASPYQPGYPGNPYASPRPYRSLDRRQKSSAIKAGAIGLNLMSLGGSILFSSLLVGALAAAFAGYSDTSAPDSGLRGFGPFLEDLGAPALFGIAVVVGLLFVGAGMFLSVALLQRGGVDRPWAVTWSGFGVSVPAILLVNFVSSFLIQIVSMAGTFALAGAGRGGTLPDELWIAAGIVFAAITIIVGAVVVGIIGALAWWWMAHVFRVRIPTATGPGAASAVPASH